MSVLSDTFILWGALGAAQRARMACPAWCVDRSGHRQSDREILRQGGVDCDHHGQERVAVDSPEWAPHNGPVTVQLRHLVGIDEDGRFEDQGPVVMLDGVPADAGLTVAEARRLAADLLAVTDVVDGGAR